MPFNHRTDTAGGVFESADVPGPVFSEPIEYGEILKIIRSDRFKQLAAAAEKQARALDAARNGRPAATAS
jgi:hypothetical protein